MENRLGSIADYEKFIDCLEADAPELKVRLEFLKSCIKEDKEERL